MQPKESGFYYLQSRYYDPSIGRFINADAVISENLSSGINQFVYTNNNPINMVDTNGYEAISISLILTAGMFATSIAGICLMPQPEALEFNSLPRLNLPTGRWLNTPSVYSIAITAVAATTQIAKSVSDSFERIKEQPNYRSTQELHHLVAQKASNARYAREILQAVGIGVNSPVNTVLIKTGLHRRLHTNSYYGWANSVVIAAYKAANGDLKRQRSNVLIALNTIRQYVLALNAVAPF